MPTSSLESKNFVKCLGCHVGSTFSYSNTENLATLGKDSNRMGDALVTSGAPGMGSDSDSAKNFVDCVHLGPPLMLLNHSCLSHVGHLPRVQPTPVGKKCLIKEIIASNTHTSQPKSTDVFSRMAKNNGLPSH